VRRVGSALDCRATRLRVPARQVLRDLRSFARLTWRMGVRSRYRRLFWSTLGKLATRNPRGLRYSIALLALYLHMDEFSRFLLQRLDAAIGAAQEPAPRSPAGTAASGVG